MARKRKPKPNKSLALRPKQETALLQVRNIVLDGEDRQGVFEREVRNANITGFLRGAKTAPVCNVIETTLRSFSADSVDFTRCDFKDDVYRSCSFKNCIFTSASMLYSAVFDSRYENCSFHDTVVQDSEFDQTVFLNCDLSHIVVKACNFSRCEFRGCKTSNKVFEMCRITDCVFENTELQLDTLAENFGITATQYRGILRDGRPDYPHHHIAAIDLEAWLKTAGARPLYKLNVDYYLKGTLLEGSPYLDESMNLSSWAPMFRTTGSFIVALNQWVAFCLWLHEHDALMIHTLVCLHSMTDQLLRKLTEADANHQALAGISGAHLSLARAIDQYLSTLDQAVQTLSQDVTFLVEGEGTEDYYYEALDSLFSRAPARITSLIPHNSPWELALRFAPHASTMAFMALFLATRTRIELSRVARTVEANSRALTVNRGRKKRKRATTVDKAVQTPQSLMRVEFGGNHPIGNNPSLQLRAFLPGNLLAELKLNIGSQRVAKLRKVLVDLLKV